MQKLGECVCLCVLFYGLNLEVNKYVTPGPLRQIRNSIYFSLPTCESSHMIMWSDFQVSFVRYDKACVILGLCLVHVVSFGPTVYWLSTNSSASNNRMLRSLQFFFRRGICTGNSLICSDIWHKHHEWYFEIVVRNLRQFWNITSGIYVKYHVQIMLLFVYTTPHKRFVIFTCRYISSKLKHSCYKPIKMKKFLM